MNILLIKSIYPDCWDTYCVVVLKKGILEATTATKGYLDLIIMIQFQKVRNTVRVPIWTSCSCFEHQHNWLVSADLYLEV